MLRYKNLSLVTKTFHGVVFKPGEVHDVKGYINDPKFVRVPTTVPETTKALAKNSVKKSDTAKPKIDSETIEGGTPDGTDCNQ